MELEKHSLSLLSTSITKSSISPKATLYSPNDDCIFCINVIMDDSCSSILLPLISFTSSVGACPIINPIVNNLDNTCNIDCCKSISLSLLLPILSIVLSFLVLLVLLFAVTMK